ARVLRPRVPVLLRHVLVAPEPRDPRPEPLHRRTARGTRPHGGAEGAPPRRAQPRHQARGADRGAHAARGLRRDAQSVGTSSVYRGRSAPSPTGDLPLGSAAAALVAWLSARAAGGRLVLRVEDLDRPRVVPGVEARQQGDLRWLGLDWDEGPDVGGPRGPYRQSERTASYETALATLARRDLLYYCDCSRAEIASVASAPDPGG